MAFWGFFIPTKKQKHNEDYEIYYDKILANVDIDIIKQKQKYDLLENFAGLPIPLHNIVAGLKDNPHIYYHLYNHPDLTPEILKDIIVYADELPNIRCHLITQSFCEQYEQLFTLPASFLLANKLPIKYIIKTNPEYIFTDSELEIIADYCTYDEYIILEKEYDIKPSIKNKHMTHDWYFNFTPIDEINWDKICDYYYRKPDLFGVDTIIKYKNYIDDYSTVWHACFDELPVAFIEANMNINYVARRLDVINIFKSHPGNISWDTIDKYITYHTEKYRNIMFDVSKIINLPLWFVKKYIAQIFITEKHINNYVNYKFLSKNYTYLDAELIAIARKHYVIMLNDITTQCIEHGINDDLIPYILNYC